MSLRETQNFLARIYTDEDVRRAFLSEPEKVGRENGLGENEVAELARVLPDELNFFSESLFLKRLREVEKLLPVTHKYLGKDFEASFREFATGFLPKTIKKHLEDAIGFAGFLQAKALEPVWTKDLAGFERAKLKFNNSGKRFLVCLFDYDIRRILRESPAEKVSLQKDYCPKRKTFAIWFRTGGRPRHFIW